MRTSALKILGTDINKAATIDEVMALSGIPETYETRPMHTPQGNQIPNHFGIYRTDKESDIEGFVGSCKQKYQIIQPREGLEFLHDVVEAEGSGSLHYEYAGPIGGGRSVMALVNLGEFDVVPGDGHDSYLGCTLSFDGNSKNRYVLIMKRRACENTIVGRLSRTSTQGDSDFAVEFSHTLNAQNRMRQARNVLAGAVRSTEDIKAKLIELSRREVTTRFRSAILDVLFPLPPEKKTENYDPDKDAARTRIVNRRDNFIELFERNDDERGFKLVEGTAYNALNAYTEWVDHEYSVVQTTAKGGMTREEIRAERALFGNGALDKTKALDAILTLTENAPRRSDGTRIFIPGANLLDKVLSGETYAIN